MKVVFRIIGVLAAVIIGYLAFFMEGYGEKLEFNGTDVYYTDMVTEAEAQKLGEYLLSSEFADGAEKSVQLSKRDSIYLFRMVVVDGVTKDSANDISFMALAWTLSAQVFNNAPVELEACDNRFGTLRVYK